MRLYHFIDDHWGRTAIKNRRLKIARIEALNDPFELFAHSFKDKALRRGFRNWKEEMNRRYGIICFSRSWATTLMWSHYGDKHKGLCLGFDVREDLPIPVTYSQSRIEIDPTNLDEALLRQLISTKAKDWEYEQEQRVFSRLEDADPSNGYYFQDFGAEIALREVIVGALNKLDRKTLLAELTSAGFKPNDVTLTKARMAFKTFTIVPDLRGLR